MIRRQWGMRRWQHLRTLKIPMLIPDFTLRSRVKSWINMEIPNPNISSVQNFPVLRLNFMIIAMQSLQIVGVNFAWWRCLGLISAIVLGLYLIACVAILACSHWMKAWNIDRDHPTDACYSQSMTQLLNVLTLKISTAFITYGKHVLSTAFYLSSSNMEIRRMFTWWTIVF